MELACIDRIVCKGLFGGNWDLLLTREERLRYLTECIKLIDAALQAKVAEQSALIAELKLAIEHMRTAGGKEEFQLAFDAAKVLLSKGESHDAS